MTDRERIRHWLVIAMILATIVTVIWP